MVAASTDIGLTHLALGSPIAETSGHADLGWAEGLFQDVFFHYQVTTHQIEIGGQEEHEHKYLAGHRWWTVDELASSRETIYPLNLADLVAELLAGRLPAVPLQLPWHH
ncbi:hypothetical protein DY245_30725 [Streptomyces inhibens]|uniref:NUDIX hydrolase n=1 Tax=Streptomyces inhibens TaxID=2293571 RepID=A0A371PW75_STRIH|nr:hypothetical protein [Streptomyces inhibens]REK86714.1 hypothetical protein DY245_30725 [Streptomyces inhibens]